MMDVANATKAYDSITVTQPCISPTTENDTLHHNVTDTPCPAPTDPVKEILENVLTIVVLVLVAIIMIGIGCSVEYKKLIKHLKKPTGIIVALLCQFIFMPVLAYVWTRIFKMEDPETLSLLIIGSCPGGTFSNIVAYWIGGDMELSIVMTTCSVIIALGMLPLLLYIYSLVLGDSDLQVPFQNVGVAIALIVIPLAIGAFIRYKCPKVAIKLLKASGILGIILMILSLGVTVYIYYEYFAFRLSQFITALFYPLCGMIFGYAITSLVSLIKPLFLCHRQRRTISIEVGIQNAQIAITIVLLSNWPIEITGKTIMLPVLYAFSQVFWAFVYIAVYQSVYFRKKGKCAAKSKEKEDEENNPQPRTTGDSFVGDNPAFDMSA